MSVENQNIEIVEEVVEETTKSKPKRAKKAAEPFFVHEGQTDVASRRSVYSFLPNTKRVVIENIGGGDLYVGTDNIDFKPENLVRVGETKEIKGVTSFIIGALSRPFYRISHFE